ncbi:MAG: DNA polymerase I [Actinomycetota bacterium]|nr:DNA polymerase I [Actinomycetota bacterium]MDA2971267.1 DNA polymerase I [Actinomycetota bacterium]MDA3001039.1 DNA polymerase I [Actinomycetota bacterium]
MSDARPTVLVLDGNSLTYRAFFGLPTDMVTASGQVTNAVYGFTSMLVTMLKEHRPAGLVVAFDRSEPTFRHEAEPTYKAQRESAPDILRQQLGIVRELLAALGVTVLELAGFEADDLIATAVDRSVEAGFDAIIVTGDRDSYQLVRDPHVRVLYNRRGVSDYVLYDEAGIAERTGVTPEQYPAYAALRGDPSDNLPGVPGVGEKTAAKLINKYGGLDGIFANVDDQTPKLRAALTDNEQLARKNENLMTLRHDVPIDFDPKDSGIEPHSDELRRLLEFLEFRSLGDRLGDALAALGFSGGSESAPREEVSVEVLDGLSADAIAGHLSSLPSIDVAGGWVGEPGRSELLGLAATVGSGRVIWISAADLVDETIASVMSSLAARGHDVKPLWRSLLRLGLEPPTLVFDSAIASYLLDPSRSTSLSALVGEHSDHVLPEAATPDGELDLGGSDIVTSVAHAAMSVGLVADSLSAALSRVGMSSLFEDVEIPLVGVLARMESVGIGVDADRLKDIARRLTIETEALAASLQDLAGGPFNPNSPAQLARILFEDKGLKPPKKTKTGYSTDAATLEKLRDEWPEFIDALLEYRELEKLRGTYGEGLQSEIADDGRIHATFQQTVARTGRLSSEHPNLHNIPVRTERGREFRDAFVPASGYVFLVADYNQIELRCIAHLAQDPGLIDAFTSGRDVHRATASQVFGVPESEVTSDQRSYAKMVSYGLAYGMEAFGLAQRLAVPVSEAQSILDAYFAAFPNVHDYMERTVAEARERGYTETLFGRRRPIPELQNANFRVRQAGERQAMNAGIQGLAADIFKVALVRTDQHLRGAQRSSRLVLQVHDEVVVEVAETEREVVGDSVIDIMRRAADLDVPLDVNFAWGHSWGAAKS